MINTSEARASSAATANAATVKSENVDPEIFARELLEKISRSTAKEGRISRVMERMAAAFPGATIATGNTSDSSKPQGGYVFTPGASASITLSAEMMLQMGEDDTMFGRVKEMLSRLFTAGKEQALVDSGGEEIRRNISVTSMEVSYTEVRQGRNGTQMSVSKLALQASEMLSDALDQLFPAKNGTGGGASAKKNSGFESLIGGSTSWRMESFISASSVEGLAGSWSSGSGQENAGIFGSRGNNSFAASMLMRRNQSFTAQVDILIEQWQAGDSANGQDLLDLMESMGLSDPLVLDLGDEGINLTSMEEGAYFDIRGDGSKAKTAWISGDNAFLYRDRNDNGVADDAHELFGDHGGFADGYAKLAQYDDNHDGVVDGSDAAYSELRLWRDLNGDGVNQKSESMTLAEAGVTSLNLRHDNSRRFDAHGNLIAGRSSFTRSDGSRGLMADAWLKNR